MRAKEILEIGEVGPLPAVGIGLLAVAVPYFVPRLRQPLGLVLKASAKLFLEAELGADNELTDRLVDQSVDALMRAIPGEGKAERKHRADRELDRFFSKAHAAAHRRSFDHQDGRRRYHKHLSRMEASLKRRQQRAGAEEGAMIDQALRRVANERHTNRTTGKHGTSAND
jgi:hypothetical protein